MAEFKDIYIVHAKRTPIGKLGGSLAQIRVDDLMANLLIDFKDNNFFDLEKIDDVIIGCANQAGEDNRNLARMAVVLAGYPFTVPGTTINRLCGSSLDATMDAACRIQTGLADCILVGGAESMTRGPYALSKTAAPFGRDQKIYDTTLGWRFENPKMKEIIPLYSMGETAEEVATKFNISRERQDQFALKSQQKAVAAIKAGKFNEEIVPIHVKLRKSEYTFTKDEGPREETTIEKLTKLRPAFNKDGSVTAGNSSTLNDGASLILVVSEKFMKENNLTPIARITGAGVRGVHPNTMGIGPVEAVKNLCTKFNKKISEFDVVELNEAFAAQSLACLDQLNIDPEITNINGGAIALGHPLGCSGTRILTTLLHIMKENKNYKQGLVSMCIGVGQGVALSVENCK
jgi:acetyl-CoA acyltransferase